MEARLKLQESRIAELEALLTQAAEALAWYSANMKKIHTMDFIFNDYGKNADDVLAKLKSAGIGSESIRTKEKL